ncbi:SusC/RagA family TonB-linked outer membrane protein [Gaoshiqia sp. Z1-71]|uniref:SusC/RagA family TonB-linked outer membrane protein n=1 Tax=Gaoshiqia hydrogeniformans TaxID=3290090 RepID=UPI003BF7DE8E
MKINLIKLPDSYAGQLKKIYLVMKLSWLLILTICLHSTASVWSQTTSISLSKSNTTLHELFIAIENQTGYRFFYNNDDVDVSQKVTVNVSGKPIGEILTQAFKDLPYTFKEMENRLILIEGHAAKTGVPSSQQSRTVSGKVTDSAGVPIPGAAVVIKGTTNGTITDMDGNYSLRQVPDDAVLLFSFVGMKPQEIPIRDRSTIMVVMEEEMVGISEVVVTALGIERESKTLSYHVQKIDAQEIVAVKDASFVNSLTGKVAGVTINSSSSGVGGSSRVIMRGVKSISGNNNALYVIDGIPMPNLSGGQPDDIFSGAGQTGDGVSNINPDDIESISVLSGPSAAALYGSSASNGVVLITTKKGQKEKLSVTLANTTLFSSPLILPKFQNTYGQTEPGSYYSWGEKLSAPSTYKPSDFFQTGVNLSNSVSLSTGSEHNQTYVSFGTVNSQGIIHNNNYDRYNFSVRNTSVFFNDKMTMDLGFMTSSVREQNMISQGQYFNPLVAVYLFPPGDDFSKVEIYERYDASRNFKTQFWPYGDQGLSIQNPYWVTERGKFINHKERYMTNATLKYEFADWVNLSGRVKMDRNNDRYEKKFSASTNTLFASENGYYSLNETETRQIYGEALLSINKYFYDQTLGLVANIGSSIEDILHNQDMYGGKLHGVANLFTYSNVNTSTSESSQSGYRKQKQSVFASAQLGYKSLAYLDLTARNDWASTLAESDTKSFFYPTIGLSGIVTDIFDIDTDIMPFMKLRVSYSEVGNEPDLFLTIPTYAVASGYPQTQTRMPNTDLKPERTKSWETGMNFVFFKNKLKLDATAYKSSTYNQFFEPTLSSSSGYTSVIVNAGRIDNKGVEVSARFNDQFGKLDFSSYLIYSLNRNKIVELLPGWTNPVTGEVISLSELDMGGTGSYKMVLKEGGSMGAIYVNTLRVDEHGAIYVHPSDQVVVPDANNFVYAGNSNPKYHIGWGNNLRWNGISLGFLVTARVGGIVVSNTQAILDAFGVSKASAEARDAGGALVNGRPIPAKDYYQTVGGGASGGIGSMYCYSATNVRLGEMTLGYNVPVKRWYKWVKELNVSLVGRNLFFLYNKAPYDPELTANTGTYFQGVDYFMSPSLRNVGFSVKVQF